MKAMPTPSTMTFRWRTWAVLLLPALLLVLATLRPLALPDEGRYAEVGRWMWMTGDWLTPRLDGIPFFHKPPLLYWLEAASMAVLGVTPWAARCVVAAHACLMWALLFVCARHLAGVDVARRAAWILGSRTPDTFLYGLHMSMATTWRSDTTMAPTASRCMRTIFAGVLPGPIGLPNWVSPATGSLSSAKSTVPSCFVELMLNG